MEGVKSSQKLAVRHAMDLASPLQPLEMEFSEEELAQTSYEIVTAACKTVVGALEKTKTGLTCVPLASQKAFAVSSIKKTLGLRSKKAIDWKSKRQPSTIDIIRVQLGISDQNDTRIRRALARTAAGREDNAEEVMLLPLELLQHTRVADFADPADYQVWQKRQLKVIEAGLLVHPAVKLDHSDDSAQRLKQLLHASAEGSLETGKDSESMQDLRSAATSLARRSDDICQDVCHWADGFPFNLHLYQMLISSCFDRVDESHLLDEIDDMIELFKRSWGILGINHALHNLCFLWVLFRQFVATGQHELDLLRATETQMAEVANDAKETEDPQYLLLLRSILMSILTWSEKRLSEYHEYFPEGGVGMMEGMIPIALNAAHILQDSDIQQKMNEEVELFRSRVDTYIRASLRTTFEKLMDQVDSDLVSLAREAADLLNREQEKWHPVWTQWHPFAASLVAATLHSCFRKELKHYLSGVHVLTLEAMEVLRSADQLEKELVRIVVEDAVDSDDGGKGLIHEMMPFEVQSTIVHLSRNWIRERIGRLNEWVERNIKQEDWNPEALREHYAPSVVEVFRLVEETLDAFFGLPVAELSILQRDLVLGLDKALYIYVAETKSGCGSKKDLVPLFPPLTRCNDAKLRGSFGSLWKKKERNAAANRRVSQETSSHNVGSESSRICVRINTLHHIQTVLDVLERRVSNGWQKDIAPQRSGKESPPSQSVEVHLRFEQTRTGVEEASQVLCEVLVYKIIFRDMRTEFWEGLYSGSVASARIGLVLELLEGQLVLIAGTVNNQLRNRIIGALMRASFEALLMVLLAGGPSRAFLISDAEMLDEDFTALKDLFKADGEGLPSETVEKAAMPVTQVLRLFGINTEDLLKDYRQFLLKVHDIQSTKSKLPIPEFTGQWDPTDANTLLRVLCYRCDSSASKFLKRAYKLPKGN